MLTPIGLVFLAASIYAFSRGSSALLGLLVFSVIFQAATIISSTAFGLQPYYLVAVFFLTRCLVDIMLKNPKRTVVGGTNLVLAFVFLGVISAAVYPLIFRGTPVLIPSDYGLGFAEGPLHPTSGNLFQACFLVMNGTVVWAASCLPGDIRSARTGIVAGFYVLAAIILIQFLFLIVHLPFPYMLINNNQHYALANAGAGYSRPNGTFSEPSGAGVALAAFSLGFLAHYVTTGRGKWRAFFAFAVLLLVSSSSSLVAIALGIGLLLLRYPILRFPFYVRLSRVRRLSFLIVLAVAILGSLAVPAVRQNLLQSTIEKGSSFSAAVRFGMDAAALQSVIGTYGIGVGVGSSRPASFIVALLSSVGIPGAVLFFAMLFRLAKNELGDRNWLKWLLTGLSIAMAAGEPDLSMPMLWSSLALIARASQPMNVNVRDSQEPKSPLRRLKDELVGRERAAVSVQR